MDLLAFQAFYEACMRVEGAEKAEHADTLQIAAQGSMNQLKKWKTRWDFDEQEVGTREDFIRAFGDGF